MVSISSKPAVTIGAAILGVSLSVGGWYALRREDVTHARIEPAGVENAPAATEMATVDASGSFRIGVEAMRKRDYAAADLAFQQIEAQWPNLPAAYFYVAQIDDQLGRADQAEQAATRYVARSPADIAGYELLARILIKAHHPDRAAAVLMAAMSAGRIDVARLELLGRSYAEAGDAERATRSFDRAAILAPDDSRIQIALASARLGLPDGREIADLVPTPAEQPGALEAAVYSALSTGDVDRAVAGLTAFRQIPGSEQASAILAGAIKAARLDYVGARADYQAVLRKVPGSVRARLNLARLDVLQGLPDDAQMRLAEVLHSDPTDMPALQASIRLLLAKNNIEQAIGLLDAARAAAPSNSLFTIMLADLLLRFGNGQKALAVIDAAPKESATLSAVMSARARALVANGSVNEARETYAGILAREPANFEARSEIIELLLARNDTDGAKAVLRNEMRTSVNKLATMEAIVRADFRAHGMASAAATADQLARDPANLPLARVLKGDFYMSGQHYPDAVSAYTDQLRTNPSSGTLQARLAMALDASGLAEQAITLLRNWTAVHANDVETLAALGSLELSNRHIDDAIGHLSAAARLQPDNAGALNDLAWAYYLKGDPRARDLARTAYLMAPTAEIADTLGWIMVGTGQSASAVPLLREASAAMPGNATALYHYAAALSGAGLPRDATRVVTGALAQPTNFAERRAAGQLLSELSRKP